MSQAVLFLISGLIAGGLAGALLATMVLRARDAGTAARMRVLEADRDAQRAALAEAHETLAAARSENATLTERLAAEAIVKVRHCGASRGKCCDQKPLV